MKLSHRKVGVLLIALTMITAVLAVPGATFNVFLDIPSLVWIIGIVAGGLLVGFPFETVSQTLRAGVFGARDLSQNKFQEFQRVLNSAYQLSWGAGIVGMLFGLIIMLSNLQNPSALGPGLSISLLMLLYAGILAEIIISGLQQGLDTNAGVQNSGAHPQSQTQPISQKRSMIGKVSAIVFLVLLQFSVLLTSLSTQPSTDLKTSWMKSRSWAAGSAQYNNRPSTAKDGVWYSFISAEKSQR